MKILKSLAQNIVEDMKKIINQDINFMDTNGIIIASTERERIGNYHEGARKVVQLNDDLIVDYDGQYEGSKKGIILPVHFESQVVGVIGITGEKHNVEKYGEIIQRMTEILIKEACLQEQKLLDRESKKQFIEELLFRTNKNDKVLKTRAELLNIDMDIPRVVVITRALDINSGELLSPSLNDKVFNSILELTHSDSQNLIVQSGMDIILIMRARTYKSIEQVVCDIKKDIESLYNINTYFGIGNIANTFKEIGKSYEKARKALDVALAFKDRHILHYSDLDIELLIDYIPKGIIEEFKDKIFEDMDPKEIDRYMEIIDKFIKHNGSITKIADELFIHKNTLQYRLNRMKTLTGYDPRVIHEMAALYIAFMFYKVKRNN